MLTFIRYFLIMNGIRQHFQRLFRLYQHPRASQMMYPVIQCFDVLYFLRLAHLIHVRLCRCYQLFQCVPLIAKGKQEQEIDMVCVFLSNALILYSKTIATIRPRIIAYTTKSFYNNWLELNLVVLQVYLYYIRHRDDALYVSWQHRVIFAVLL